MAAKSRSGTSGQVTMNLAARCPRYVRPDVRVLRDHLTIMTAWPVHTCGVDQSGDLVSRKAESLVTEALADTLPFGDRLRALPIDALWNPEP
jgi:hypothetical protein